MSEYTCPTVPASAFFRLLAYRTKGLPPHIVIRVAYYMARDHFEDNHGLLDIYRDTYQNVRGGWMVGRRNPPQPSVALT